MITIKKDLTNDFDLIRIASHLQKEIEDLNKENDFYCDMIIRLEKNLQMITTRLKEIEIYLSIT